MVGGLGFGVVVGVGVGVGVGVVFATHFLPRPPRPSAAREDSYMHINLIVVLN